MSAAPDTSDPRIGGLLNTMGNGIADFAAENERLRAALDGARRALERCAEPGFPRRGEVARKALTEIKAMLGDAR